MLQDDDVFAHRLQLFDLGMTPEESVGKDFAEKPILGLPVLLGAL